MRSHCVLLCFSHEIGENTDRHKTHPKTSHHTLSNMPRGNKKDKGKPKKGKGDNAKPVAVATGAPVTLPQAPNPLPDERIVPDNLVLDRLENHHLCCATIAFWHVLSILVCFFPFVVQLPSVILKARIARDGLVCEALHAIYLLVSPAKDGIDFTEIFMYYGLLMSLPRHGQLDDHGSFTAAYKAHTSTGASTSDNKWDDIINTTLSTRCKVCKKPRTRRQEVMFVPVCADDDQNMVFEGQFHCPACNRATAHTYTIDHLGSLLVGCHQWFHRYGDVRKIRRQPVIWLPHKSPQSRKTIAIPFSLVAIVARHPAAGGRPCELS